MFRMKRRLFSLICLRWSVRKVLALMILAGTLLIFVSIRTGQSSWMDKSSFVLPSPMHFIQKKGFSQDVPAVGKVILMTYGRSGSTFTSEVIQQDPGVFYTFEPLFNLIRRQLGKSQATSSLFLQASEQARTYFEKCSVDLVEIFLSCGFEALNISDITNFQLRNSEDSRILWGCVQRPKGNDRTPTEILDCFLNARKTCLTRPVKMVKTIRFRGTAARQILAKHDDLKLLYLIRDPRGTLTSQRSTFNAFKWEDVGNFSADYCQVVREDLAVLGELVDRYPLRVKVLRYETLAENPIKMSEKLYDFLGLNFTTAVKTFVYNRTMAGHSPNSAYGTARSNSTQTAYSWRARITLPSAKIIDLNCKDVYNKLGYIPVNTVEDLKDLSHSLRTPVQFHGQDL